MDQASDISKSVTLLYFDDCPNWAEAAGHLATLADEDPGLVVSHIQVNTSEEAVRVGFRGSPSFIVDVDGTGVDPFADADAPVGLSCRVYETPDGMAGSPTLEQLRAALALG
ncbi:MAG: hypothetical protein MAG471_01850 [Acidimicrobiaceae bacterium]|nr:hypothetical protein [Acidimicrobiaceae bacterium]